MTALASTSDSPPASAELSLSQPETTAAAQHWQAVCPIDDIWPNTGVCALLQGRQIAIFRLADGRLFALDNHDPKSCANVLWRGIVGDIAGEPVVASPIYKEHYQLRTGQCVEDAAVQLHTYAVQLREGQVWVAA